MADNIKTLQQEVKLLNAKIRLAKNAADRNQASFELEAKNLEVIAALEEQRLINLEKRSEAELEAGKNSAEQHARKMAQYA